MKPKIFAADKEKALAKSLTEHSMNYSSLTHLAGKHILITGASQGIGHTLALVAASAGAQTILLDKSIPALESLYDDVMAVDSRINEAVLEPFLLPIDMAGANLDDYLESAELLAAEIPCLDSIIHNAAYFTGLYALAQTPAEDLIKQMQVNYTAPIWLTQALFTLLQKSGTPTLLFADHQESHAHETAYYNSYAASKLALMQAAKQFALENEHLNLYAYGYNTGWVNTTLARQAYPHAQPHWPVSQDAKPASQILMLLSRKEANGSIVTLASSG